MATYIVDPGGTGDYLSLAACITGLAGDKGGEAIVIQFHSSDGSADTSQVTITGITNYSSFLIEPHPTFHTRTGAKWDANEYRLTVSDQFLAVVYPQIDDIIIDGLQIEQTGNFASSRGMLLTGISPTGTITVKNCYVRFTNVTPPIGGVGIQPDIGGTNHIINNVIEGFYEGIFTSGLAAGSEVNAYNNTIKDCVNNGIYITGYPVGAAVLNIKNNILAGSGTLDYYTEAGVNLTLTEATNSSSDTSSPTVALRSIAPTFIDAANGDYHLAANDTDDGPADTSFTGVGTDLSSDTYFPFDYDSDNVTRISWDIGADEIEFSGLYQQTTDIDVTITVDSDFPGAAAFTYPLTGDINVALGVNSWQTGRDVQTGAINVIMGVNGTQSGTEATISAYKLQDIIFAGPRRF